MTIGDTDSLPKRVAEQLKETIQITSKNTGLTLVLGTQLQWKMGNCKINKRYCRK